MFELCVYENGNKEEMTIQETKKEEQERRPNMEK